MRKLEWSTVVLALIWIIVSAILIYDKVNASDVKPNHTQTSVAVRVLQEFSQLIGEPVNLNNVQKLTVTYKLFGSTALDCPKFGIGYADVQTAGYIVTFKYQGVTVDYRTDVRLTTIILCHLKVKHG